MLPVNDSFSIVLIGSWNPSIFSQDWVLNNLADSNDANISMSYPIEDPTAPRKIDFEGVTLFPGRKQLHIASAACTAEGIRKCAGIIVKILDLLSHTPVHNCGINFSFEELDNLAQINEVLNIGDEANIEADNYRLMNTLITRKYRLEDGNFLNLSLSDSANGMKVIFNYHYELNNIPEYRDMFVTEHIIERYESAIMLCQNVYGLQLEEGDNNDE